jgi:hypothetical protein
MRQLLVVAWLLAVAFAAHVTLSLRTINNGVQSALGRAIQIPQHIEYTMPTAITLHHYDSDGNLLVSATFTQGASESTAAFHARVRAEWDAIVAEFG